MKKFRVLGHPWHAGHNYELLKLPVDWSYLPGDRHKHFRPLPSHVKQVGWDFDPNHYDLILTHFSHESCGYFEKLRMYAAKLPVVVIMHGMPAGSVMAEAFREMAGDILVVCNARRQEREWGFLRSKTILHGFSPDEWLPTTYGRREAVVSLPGISADYPWFGYNYGISTLEEVRRRIPVTWLRRDRGFKNWDDYRWYLRQCSIYYNPTRRSPNPRSRGEAMMMGLVPVTTAFFDEEEFIEDGWNGFIVPDDAAAVAEVLGELIGRPNLCREVGLRARETAIKRFGWDRWAKEWMETIEAEVRR